MTKTKPVKTKSKKIEFEPISAINGQIMLTIYPPGTFIDNKYYYVFLGGCGYGERKTFKEARTFLLECAKNYCLREIETARQKENHYKIQLYKLSVIGLEKKKRSLNGLPHRDLLR